ncbi:MAG TPA: transglutaminase family protein [Polyangiaceae bacterium]|nr:transglutaminase family protein [Polyangiaceae bacterium]
MLIRAGYEISIECDDATPLMALVSLHPSRTGDLRSPAVITSSGPAPLEASLDEFGNLRTRTLAPAGMLKLSTQFIVHDSGLPDEVAPGAQEVPVEQLPDEAVSFLLGSRYCETDRLSELAWSLFGQVPPGWARVQAIVDYVHQRLRFGYQFARKTRTAWEGHEEQVGVCRDFAHLAITLCRCMNIPARYATGYLGDIGVPPVPAPMDFSAWFEAYLGGRWFTFDARHNTPRIGRILVARGRDAADCAITTTFGTSRLLQFDIVTEEVSAAELRKVSRAA